MADTTDTSSWWDSITNFFTPSSDTTSTDGLYWNADKGWVDSSGNVIYSGADATSSNLDSGVINQKAMELGIDPSTPNAGGLIGLATSLGTSAWEGLKKAFTTSDGKTDWGKLAGVGGGIYSMLTSDNNQKPIGYQGGIPSYTMVRQQVPGTYNPDRRPGSGGQLYFTDAQFVNPANVAAAQEAAAAQAATMQQQNATNPASYPVQAKSGGIIGYADGGTIDVGGYASNGEPPVVPPHVEYQMQQNFSSGGIAALAGGNYLAGATDGMADKIPATISGKQPAKLSHGEFVVPADVVSHLGNGNSEAGADRLYSMMDKVRKARTGTVKQGKQINPNKFMPG